jgi:hypothetical protein
MTDYSPVILQKIQNIPIYYHNKVQNCDLDYCDTTIKNLEGTNALVFNKPNSKFLGLDPYYYRRTVKPPKTNYQKQQLIQNTVRVDASLFTENKGPLSAYTEPIYDGVNWNQQSDRPVPSFQKSTVPTGNFSSLNGRYSVTSSKPGSQVPGGYGCDIKHNSYDRYLNRLKGKGPLKGQIEPPYIPNQFNLVAPIYGGKTFKTNIVTDCKCV